MIVEPSQVEGIFALLQAEPRISLDTETTGLQIHRADRIFSIIVGCARGAFYFNFRAYPEEHGVPVLTREAVLPHLRKLLENRIVYMHNAKFDIAALSHEEVTIQAKIFDTEVGARLEYNEHLTYSLADCAKRIGLEKSEAVDDYIKKHKLFEWRTIPGKKTRAKNKHYFKVPFHVIAPYGVRDAEVTFALGEHQTCAIEAFDAKYAERSNGSLSEVRNMEARLTPVLYKMERTGLLIDREYCGRAIEYYDEQARSAEVEFKKLVGVPLKDSGQHLAKVFSALGVAVETTAKGNPSFTDECLEGINHPVVAEIRKYRSATKSANTYFRSFLFHADSNGRVHTNLRQAGTKTGRLSCSEPNLQNLTKDEEVGNLFPVRRAFIPSPGYFFCMLDYDQMELRLMLDYAGETALSDKIMAGLDPHQATADMTGLTRRAAKTLSFGLIYGMGIAKLAASLGVNETQAREFKARYFSALPRVRRFIRMASERAEQTKLLRSWDGRAFHFPDPRFAYKGANSVIQGGCASIMKQGLIDIDHFLAGRKSRLVLTIHDEADLEIHESEAHIIPELAKILSTVYPQRYLPLTASPSYSFTSLGDPVEGLPDARGAVQTESAAVS